MSRHREIAANLSAVRGRIAHAAEASGRDPGVVTVVVVTKFFPVSDVRILADLGVTDIGENRHQEAMVKVAACRDLHLRWHFVGGLQSNKAAAVASYADVVESVDRAKLVPALQRGAHRRADQLDCLVQVSLDPVDAAGDRFGCDPAEVVSLSREVEEAGALRLRGLMAVAPVGEDPATAFARLASIRETFRAEFPQAGWLSAGMSGDFEPAVTQGATHVRIGSAILGPRPDIQ